MLTTHPERQLVNANGTAQPRAGPGQEPQDAHLSECAGDSESEPGTRIELGLACQPECRLRLPLGAAMPGTGRWGLSSSESRHGARQSGLSQHLPLAGRAAPG
jgi:hypothetical protein